MCRQKQTCENASEDEMLAQILHDLYVPRELLDGLPEDQKQLLFCKMREEQVRRYHQREDDESNNSSLNKTPKKTKKQVSFRLDANGNELCWVLGESERFDSSIQIREESEVRTNNENFSLDQDDNLRIHAGANYSPPIRNAQTYYTAHRDERKQIEEISNNIQEARRIFERLESETRRLVLNKESEVLQQRNVRNDSIDDGFYREIEERAKKADRDRREAARRARNEIRRTSIELNVEFDSNEKPKLLVQPTPNFGATNNETEIQIEFVQTKNNESNVSSFVDSQRSRPLLPLTREDIRHWFCLSEIPYGAFRSSDGKFYPWFHGIISRAHTEQLLSNKPIGTFLIRINEKIFGYALSYRASDHCRHLLIEVISEDNNKHAYRFLGGAKNELFSQLTELIDKYSNTPIRSNSNDVLRQPCGQIDPDKPDYADLFPDLFQSKQDDPLYISLETTTSSTPSMTHL